MVKQESKHVVVQCNEIGNVRLVILFDMFLNASFKTTTSFTNVATILAKAYETNFSVSVKKGTKGKVQFQFLNSFSPKFLFWEKN